MVAAGCGASVVLRACLLSVVRLWASCCAVGSVLSVVTGCGGWGRFPAGCGCCVVGLVVVVGCWGWVAVLVLLWCCWCLLAGAAVACCRLGCFPLMTCADHVGCWCFGAGFGWFAAAVGCWVVAVVWLSCCPAVAARCRLLLWLWCWLAVVLVVLWWVLRFGGAAAGWWVLSCWLLWLSCCAVLAVAGGGASVLLLVASAGGGVRCGASVLWCSLAAGCWLLLFSFSFFIFDFSILRFIFKI